MPKTDPPSWAQAQQWCADRNIALDPEVPKRNDPAEFWPLAGAYDALCVRHPVLRRGLVAIVHDRKATGFSATENLGGGLASVALTRQDNSEFVDSKDTAPRSPLEAWMHELGHVYHNATPGLIEALPAALARAGVDPNEISPYAAENPQECFAELFCLFNRGGALSGLEAGLAARLRAVWDRLGLALVAKAEPVEPWRAVHAAADAHVARFTGPFVAAVEALRRRVTINQLEECVTKGEITWEVAGAIDAVKVAKIAADPADLATKVYAETIVAAVTGQAAYVESVWGAAGATIIGRFNVVSPFVLRAAETLVGDMIRGVGAETKAAVRRIIFNATRDGVPPREAAKQIRDILGLTTRQALAVNRLEQGLLDQGADPRFARAQGRRYSEQLLKSRAENIARTETMRAATTGQDLLWSEMRDAGVLPPDVTRRWLVTPDDRLCPRCAPLNGKTAQLGYLFRETEQGVLPSKRVPVAGTTTLRPPLHPRCRCVLVLVDVE